MPGLAMESLRPRSTRIAFERDSRVLVKKLGEVKIPSTKMTFAGIKNEDEAKNLWAYLKQYDADGKTK
jgi:hypothetical protein